MGNSLREERIYSIFDNIFRKKNVKESRFVVQMHSASHLHFDFRLEVGDKLISWAVPKTISMDPKVKRLAVRVNDHTPSYIDFEGRIAKGNYGAGSVIVWDRGTYKSANLETIEKQLKEGKLNITLSGAKLKGDWHLFKLKGVNNPNWMLMKKRDSFSGEEIKFNNKSVISGKTVENI